MVEYIGCLHLVDNKRVERLWVFIPIDSKVVKHIPRSIYQKLFSLIVRIGKLDSFVFDGFLSP